MKNKFPKAELGKKIFMASLIISIIAFIAVFVWSLSQPSDTEEQVAMAAKTNYCVLFYVFTIIIPSGAIVREILGYPYNKKKIMIKIGVSLLLAISGTILFFLVDSARIWQFADIAAIFVLMYTITPTVKEEKKENNEKV